MHRAYIGKIAKGKKEEYIKSHENVWPELIEAMKNVGVEKESCFVFENYIFVYVEAQDIDGTMRKLTQDPINQKWDVYMEPLLEKPGQSSPDFFPEMTEVFEFSKQ